MSEPNERDRELAAAIHDYDQSELTGDYDTWLTGVAKLFADHRLTLEREMRELGPCGHPKLFLEIDSHGEGETAVSFVMGCPFCRELTQKNRLERAALLRQVAEIARNNTPNGHHSQAVQDILAKADASDFSALDAYVAETVRQHNVRCWCPVCGERSEHRAVKGAKEKKS